MISYLRYCSQGSQRASDPLILLYIEHQRIGVDKLFYKQPPSKCFRLCTPNVLCSSSILPLQRESSPIKLIKIYKNKQWAKISPYILFTNHCSRIKELKYREIYEIVQLNGDYSLCVGKDLMEGVTHNELDFILVLPIGYSLPDMQPLLPSNSHIYTTNTFSPFTLSLNLIFSVTPTWIKPFKMTTLLPLSHDRTCFLCSIFFSSKVFLRF